MKKILIYLILPILISACADEQYELIAPEHLLDVPEGKAQINIAITAGNFHKPGTKTINPDAEFSNPYIMSFRLTNTGSTTDTILHEVVKTTLNGGKYNALLTRSMEPHLLVFIANADSLVRHRIINHSIITKRYGEVMPLFTYGDPTNIGSLGLYGLKNPTIFIPFVNERIPMWAKLNIDKIETSSKISTPVYLQRIVSKLYVDAREANKKDNFTLTGFTVLGVPSHAYIDNDGAANKYSPQMTVNYGQSSSGNTTIDKLIIENISGNTTQSVTNDKPVYVFPFRKDDERGGVYHILFSGHFGDNVIKYFKVKIGGPDSPAALSKPNTSYRINIESIANNGYVSLAQALQYEPGTGVVVKVILLDNSHELIGNRKYFLGISNSSYELYGSGEYDNIKIATVTTNAFNNGSVTPSSKIELLPGSTHMSLVPGQTLNSNSTDIFVKFTAQNIASGTVRVTIGDLVKEITVRKTLPLKSNYNESGMLISDKVIRAKLTGETTDYVDFAGLAFADNSPVKMSEVCVGDITNTGENLYLYFRREVCLQNFKIHISRYDGDSKISEIRQQRACFAGSNIYWDHLGKRLKFDDTPLKGTRAPHEAYMGLMFKWGSLVGLGPTSNFKCTFDPLNYNYANSSDVPFSAAHIPSTDIYSDDDALAQYSKVNEYNLGKGDICRFMTARGLTPNYTKWRLPTAKELVDLYPLLSDSYGDFRPEPSKVTDANGHYAPYSGLLFGNICFPMSGIASFNYAGHIGEIGFIAHLNTATAHTSANCSSAKMSRNSVGMMSGGKEWFRSVRCVRDISPGKIIPLYKIEYDLNEADGGSVTIPVGSKLLNMFVDKGGSVTLSNVVLQSSAGKVHTGWLINNKYYALGETITNIQEDLTAKAVWGFIAGSNIYWDGSKLTFDDIPVKQNSPNEHKQGVMFKFGSLVAIGSSSHNDSWDPFPPNYPLNSKVMDVTAANPVWENIPYSSVIEAPIPAGVNTGGDPYLLRVHDVPNKIGDICKYLTDRGWAPGADKGVKWRMPTHQELQGQIYVFKGTDWTPLVLDNPGKMYDGNFEFESGVYLPSANVFYPTSGSRKRGTMNNPRNYGDYWLSSIEGGGAWAFYFKDKNQRFNLTATHDAAFAARCIRDIKIR